MGFIYLYSISVKINCPELDAIAPAAEDIPNPKPLARNGKISVTYKKNIEK